MIAPLNIAMVAACPFPTSQGSQVLIRELSEKLAERGHRVHLVTYHFGEDIPCRKVTIHRIPQLFPYNKFRSGPSLRKPLLDLLLSVKLDQVVREHDIQLIHCHNYEAPVAAFPVRKLRRVPVLYHSHNTMSDEFYTYFRLKIPQVLARGAAHLMDRFIPRRADFVIAINRKVEEFLVRMGTDPRKIRFLPPGIDYGEPARPDETALRREFGLGDGPLIIYAGNLDGYQRLDLLLDALPDVFDRHPSARWVVLTSSSPVELHKEVRKRGMARQVTVIERLSFERIKEVFAVGAVAVNPRVSWSGYPIKLLNYMAAGLPVVAFEDAAPPIEDGVNGFLVPAGDVRRYGERIARLLGNREEAAWMGAQARKTALVRYSWERIVEQVEAIYARMLDVEFEPSARKDVPLKESAAA